MNANDIRRFEAKINRTPTCWLWTACLDHFGYGMLWYNGGSIVAHRFSWALWRGGKRLPRVMCVLHKCDVPACVNPDHLFLGTKAENNKDRSAKGRTRCGDRRGEKHPLAKLTERDVLLIRKLYVRGETTYKDLGIRFGVRASTIPGIVKRKSWLHI